MSHTDKLKEAYEAFGSGDVEKATENFADDISWEESSSERVPGYGTHIGRQDIIQNSWAAIPQSYDYFRLTPDEFIESGDTVVVLGQSEAKATATGREFNTPFVHVWRFEDDKVKRAQLLSDTAVVADAMS